MSNKTRAAIFWLLAVPTILLCFASLAIVVHLWYPVGLTPAELQLHIINFSIIYALWMIVLFMHNVFELEHLRSNVRLVFNLVSAMAVNFLVAVLYFYFQPNLTLTPRRFLLAHVALTFVLLLLWQLMVKYFLGRRLLVEQLHLFVNDETPAEFIAELEKHRLLGFRIVGTINKEQLPQLTGNITLVIPESNAVEAPVLRQFYELRRHAVTFYNYKNLYEMVSRKVYLPSLDELWFLENIRYDERRAYRFFKRLIDLIVGGLGFVMFVVLYPFIFLAIKLESRGPVLFKQQRIGKYGTIFTVYKFRTMRGEIHNTWTGQRDPRITRVGRVLRRLRLDELPQCLNLLEGNMSLVGPRPEQPHIAEQLRLEIPFYEERHLVKPGLTGWGQLNVYARTIEQSKIKLQYDLYYVKHRSLLFDWEIILKTLYHVFTTGDN